MDHKIIGYIFFIVIFVTITNAQFNKYIPPNNINYINCTLRDGVTQKSYCPIGTECVNSVMATNVWYPGMKIAQTLLSEITAPGCCPSNTTPCLSKNMPFNMPGCCPNGKRCCFSKFNTNRFLGCADDTAQCCGDTICPTGYSCCYQDNVANYYCCPGTSACSPIIGNSSTVNETVVSRIPNNYFPGSNPLLQIRPYSQCLRITDNGTNVGPWPEDMVIPCGQFGSLCLNATEDCISKNGINLSLNPNNNNTIFEQFGDICCKKNTTICPMSEKKNQRSIIGCADESIGESCCASQICPPKSKCCHFLAPETTSNIEDPYFGTWQTNTLFNSILYNTSYVANPLNESAIILPSSDICCPEGTYCCAILLNLDKSLDPSRRRVYGYCGRNEFCTSIATVSETFQPVPSFSGFLPDYIENNETIQTGNFYMDPTLRFSTQFNSIYNYSALCNNCNYKKAPQTSSCPTSCGDQCALDITARYNQSP